MLEIIQLAFQLSADQQAHPVGDVTDEFAAGEDAFGDDFGGGARRGGAQVGDKIADGEIDFMADGGYDGQGGFKNGASDDFFVEGPEVFEAAAAACH